MDSLSRDAPRHRHLQPGRGHRSSVEESPKEQAKQILIAARGPAKLIEGSHYSIEFAVQVVVDKYLYHLPLERQIRQMESLGLRTKPKVLYNLCAIVAARLEGVCEKIRDEILSANLCVHCDETPWPITNAKDDDGYLWILSNQAGSYYRFEPTRSGKVIEEALRGYAGSTLADGYQGYHRLKSMPGIRLAHCWTHARRKFIELEELYPAEAKACLDPMEKLFAIERRAQTYEELAALRRDESTPVIRALHERLLALRPESREESALRRAIDYCLKYWTGLTAFLSDAKIPLTNNDAERAIRHAVLGRKNFQGSRSIDGADVAATLYTLIESCKKVELDPSGYLKYALETSAAEKTPLTPFQLAKEQRMS